MTLGSSKKALEEHFIKFIKRLNTVHDQWIIMNDMWIPAERTQKTRPGLHIAHNPYLGVNTKLMETVYKSEPLPSIIEDYESLKGKISNIDYIQTSEMITLEINIGGSVVIIVVARVMYPDEAEKKLPGILYGKTFEDLIARGGNEWVEIAKDDLKRLKNGNIMQITRDGFVLMRLVRSLFKLRGRSERANADITYESYYNFEYFDTDSIMNMGGITFSLFVSYGFLCCIHRYLPVPYPENPGDDIKSLWEKLENPDLGLFDEDDADDGLEVVD